MKEEVKKYNIQEIYLEAKAYNKNILFNRQTFCSEKLCECKECEYNFSNVPLEILENVFFNKGLTLSEKLKNRLICTDLVDYQLLNKEKKKIQYWIENARFEPVDYYSSDTMENSIKLNRTIFQDPESIVAKSLSEPYISFLFEKNFTEDQQGFLIKETKIDTTGILYTSSYNGEIWHVYDLGAMCHNKNQYTDIIVNDSISQASHLVFFASDCGFHEPFLKEKPIKTVAIDEDDQDEINHTYKVHTKQYMRYCIWQKLFDLLKIIKETPHHIKYLSLRYYPNFRIQQSEHDHNQTKLLQYIIKLKKITDSLRITLSIDPILKTLIKNNEPVKDLIIKNAIKCPSKSIKLILNKYLLITNTMHDQRLNPFLKQYIVYDFNNFYLQKSKISTTATQKEIDDDIYYHYVLYVLEKYKVSKNNKKITDLVHNTFLCGHDNDREENVRLFCTYLIPTLHASLPEYLKTQLVTDIVGDLEKWCEIIPEDRNLLIQNLDLKIFLEWWRFVQLPEFKKQKARHYKLFTHFFNYYHDLNDNDINNSIKNFITDNKLFEKIEFNQFFYSNLLSYIFSKDNNSTILYNSALELITSSDFFFAFPDFSGEKLEEIYTIKKNEILLFVDTNPNLLIEQHLDKIILHGSQTMWNDIFTNQNIKNILKSTKPNETIKIKIQKIRNFLNDNRYNGPLKKQKENFVCQCIFKYLSFCNDFMDYFLILNKGKIIETLCSLETTKEIKQFKNSDQTNAFSKSNRFIMKELIEMVQNQTKNFNTTSSIMNILLDTSFIEACDKTYDIGFTLFDFLNALSDRIQYELNKEDRCSTQINQNTINNIIDTIHCVYYSPIQEKLPYATKILNIMRLLQNQFGPDDLQNNKILTKEILYNNIKKEIEEKYTNDEKNNYSFLEYKIKDLNNFFWQESNEVALAKLLSIIDALQENENKRNLKLSEKIFDNVIGNIKIHYLLLYLRLFDKKDYILKTLEQNPPAACIFDILCKKLEKNNTSNRYANTLDVYYLYFNYLKNNSFIDSKEKVAELAHCIDLKRHFGTFLNKKESVLQFIKTCYDSCNNDYLSNMLLKKILKKIKTIELEVFLQGTKKNTDPRLNFIEKKIQARKNKKLDRQNQKQQEKRAIFTKRLILTVPFLLLPIILCFNWKKIQNNLAAHTPLF